MKVVLVIDRAESCTGCMLGIYNKKWFCLATNRDINICDRYNIPEWCPLRPLPDKLDANDWHRMFDGLFSEREAKGYGWNACLEEIEKNVLHE